MVGLGEMLSEVLVCLWVALTLSAADVTGLSELLPEYFAVSE